MERGAQPAGVPALELRMEDKMNGTRLVDSVAGPDPVALPKVAAGCPWVLAHFAQLDGAILTAELSREPAVIVPQMARVAMAAQAMAQFLYRHDAAQQAKIQRQSVVGWAATMVALGGAPVPLPVPLRPDQPWFLVAFARPLSCAAVTAWSEHLLPEQLDLIAFALGEQARWHIVDHPAAPHQASAGRASRIVVP
jgi:hypothetical protein